METYHNAFLEREKGFIVKCGLIPMICKFSYYIELLFDIRLLLEKESNSKEYDLLDTIMYYWDMQIEDVDSISILTQKGYFSSTACILRRVQLSIARIIYIIDHPDSCAEIRKGKKYTDKELMNYLSKSRGIDDLSAYNDFCKATHLNYEWTNFAKECNILTPIEKKSCIAIESQILAAWLYVLTGCGEIIKYLLDNSSTIPNSISEFFNYCSSLYKIDFNYFRIRLDEIYPDESE